MTTSLNTLADNKSLPRILTGVLDQALITEDFMFEDIKQDGRTKAKIHWLFKSDEANGASAGIVQYFPGGITPMHRHTGFEMALILDGEMNTSTGVVKKNDLLVLKPDSVHESWTTDVGCTVLIIWFQPVEKL